MKFDILTIFPDIIHDYSEKSILGRAQKAGKIEICAINFRDFTADKFHRVDDTPYSGGAGMILQVEPIYNCLKAIKALKSSKFKVQSSKSASELKSEVRRPKTKIIILDPAGKKFDEKMAERFSKLDRLVLICGRYEGFDERIYKFADEKVSVGDYVLSGGELPALVVVEATARLLPGVLGNEESLKEETHSNFKFQISNVKSNPKFKCQKLKIENCKLKIAGEYPQYTRPANFMGMRVPKILLTGDHKKIAEWRNKKSIKS